MAVPRHRRGDVGIFRREVQSERAAATEPGHADALGARPALLPRVVGRGLDVPEVLGARDLARDLSHLREVLALHSTFAAVELGRDRVIARLSEAAHDVLFLLSVVW